MHRHQGDGWSEERMKEQARRDYQFAEKQKREQQAMEKALAKACGANDESISLEALLASVNKSIKPQVRRAEMCALLQHMHELNRIYFDASSDTVMPI